MILNLIRIACLFVASNFADDDQSTLNQLSYQVNLLNFKHQTTQSHMPYSFRNSSLAVDGNIYTCSYVSPDPQKNGNSWWKITLDRVYDVIRIRLLQDKNLLGTTFVIYMQVIVSNDKDQRLCMWLRKKYLIFSNGYRDLPCLYSVNGKFITLKNEGGWLFICEVQVFADLRSVNLAYKRPFAQRGYLLIDTSFHSVDGDPLTCGVMKYKPSVWPWLRVVLDKIYFVTDVSYSFKKPKTNEWYLEKSIVIYVSDNVENYEERLCGGTSKEDYIDSKETSLSLKCQIPIPGRFVTITKYLGEYPDILVICEVEVYSRRLPHAMSNISSPFCYPHEYTCLDGRCIHRDWLCDGTNDCPHADDEAPSCKGDESQFKCKRINDTISIKNRCNGFYNCPDNSDEEHCFEMYTEPLTATFNGESDFYICSDGWHVTYSANICQQYDRDHTATFYVSFHEAQKFLKINKQRTISGANGFMTLFDKSYNCHSKKVVHIKCAYKEDESYLCGKRYLPDALYEPYVIKGRDSSRMAWPWHVQVFIYTGLFYERTFCGGSLIHKDWVLTAAHCVDTIKNVNKIYMKIGSNVYDDIMSDRYYASHVIVHPLYKRDANDSLYDMALIRLKSMAVFSAYVRPICLSDKQMDRKTLMSFRHCVVAGFGHTGRDGERSYLIQQARMNFVENAKCALYLNEGYELHETNIHYELEFYSAFCVGQLPFINGSSTCYGDSGSPWMCKSKNGVWTQIGVAHGEYIYQNQKCTNSIFVHVGHYLDFIRSTMKAKYISTFGKIFITHFDVIPYLILDVMIKWH